MYLKMDRTKRQPFTLPLQMWKHNVHGSKPNNPQALGQLPGFGERHRWEIQVLEHFKATECGESDGRTKSACGQLRGLVCEL